MPGETSGRPLLPQTAQMQSFTFAPPTLAPRENQRNYVFVDEHNRHKRLKVMRACEGCRRRKIKCDAATTNSWPCAACIRLKLNCVPPTVSYDKDYSPGSHTFEIERPQAYNPSPSGQDDYQRQHVMQHLPPDMPSGVPPNIPGTYADNLRMYQTTAPFMEQQPHPQEHLQYAPMPQSQAVGQDLSYQPHPMYPESSASALSAADSKDAWQSENTADITDALGELRIDHTAVAPYIANQKKALAQAPAQEEYEVQLPPMSTLDHTIRIPPEMMPSEQQVLQYFEYFFSNIHPYCPVINRNYFYQQWQTARDSISPLLLEAIFACASLMLEGNPQGNKWLALASKHEDSFKDVPRLSTIQAMILLLKARESAPKRGYFYRSWMTVVNSVAMAKDLEMDDHFESHQLGKSCGTSFHDCVTKTRVWQTLFVLEVMVGGPQGRFDFQINVDTVDLTTQRPVAGLDDAEYQISRQFTQYIRTVKNVQRTTLTHGLLKKKKDWALDPEFVQLNANYPAWLRELPEDMQIQYPADGSAPWISSHFIANMHSYHHLSVIMHHRAQLHAFSGSFDGVWKQHMVICYSAAKCMCKLQEAILKIYGLPGLLCMQRGMSFTIYSVLTCTMLHLVAMTCPDPVLNNDAREFFVRHMRILETCTPSWPMPEMHEQVNNLRQAFSADLTKPFELKPSFPFGSPQVQSHTSPLSNGDAYRSRNPSQHSPLEQPGQVNYHAHPITPPISATDQDPKTDSPVVQSLVMMAAGQRGPQTANSVHMQEPVQWNPTRIFDQWNTAFGTPPPSSTSQSSPPLRPPPPGTYEARTPQDGNTPGYQLTSASPNSAGMQNTQAQLPPPVSYAAPNTTTPYVTPSMWQDVVASSFGDSLKRRWDYGNPSMIDQQMHKRAR